MKKQVILLADGENAPAVELLDGLNAAGISVFAHDLTETQALADGYPENSHPLAILYEVPTGAKLQDLSRVVSRANELWPSVPIVACRQAMSRPGDATPDNRSLTQLGFQAIADSPPQLPALLRQVEDVVDTGG